MKVIHLLDLLRNERYPVLLAAGFFDGMHKGHQRLIQRAVAESQKGAGTVWVMTFDTHPAKVLHPETAPSLLTSTPHKLHLMKQLGVEGCVAIPFTRALAKLEPEAFITSLVRSIPSLHSLFIGKNWTFGRDGKGTSDLLKSLAKAHGFHVFVIPPVLWKRQPISSTRIRQKILAGNLEHAASMLGRPVSIWGTVTAGRKIGRSIGIPTANLNPHNEIYPPDGVYAARATMESTSYPGIVNLGTRPTISGISKCRGVCVKRPSPALGTSAATTPHAGLPSRSEHRDGLSSRPKTKRILELHLFDVRCNLYRKDIEVFFLKKLRNERLFDSLEILKHQIVKDIDKARKWLSRHGEDG